MNPNLSQYPTAQMQQQQQPVYTPETLRPIWMFVNSLSCYFTILSTHYTGFSERSYTVRLSYSNLSQLV